MSTRELAGKLFSLARAADTANMRASEHGDVFKREEAISEAFDAFRSAIFQLAAQLDREPAARSVTRETFNAVQRLIVERKARGEDPMSVSLADVEREVRGW